MKVLKRSGEEVDFSREKIYRAIAKANEEVRAENEKNAASEETLNAVVTRLYERCRKRPRPTPAEEIQDMIEIELMKEKAYEVAQRYIRYRCEKAAEAKEKGQADVIVYTQRGCGKCDILKRQLAAKDIDYDEVSDINEMIAIGLKRTPMLKVDGEFLDYSAAIQWIKNNKGEGYEKQ